MLFVGSARHTLFMTTRTELFETARTALAELSRTPVQCMTDDDLFEFAGVIESLGRLVDAAQVVAAGLNSSGGPSADHDGRAQPSQAPEVVTVTD
jgi:hypothetical protein